MDKYVYQVNKGYMIGLPARDMNRAEWEAYPKELTKAALKLGLYKIKKPKISKEVKNA